MIIAKDGTTINVIGSTITTSRGETYHLTGRCLIGPTGTVSMNVSSMDEAIGIVIGIHGGRRM